MLTLVKPRPKPPYRLVGSRLARAVFRSVRRYTRLAPSCGRADRAPELGHGAGAGTVGVPSGAESRRGNGARLGRPARCCSRNVLVNLEQDAWWYKSGRGRSALLRGRRRRRRRHKDQIGRNSSRDGVGTTPISQASETSAALTASLFYRGICGHRNMAMAAWSGGDGAQREDETL